MSELTPQPHYGNQTKAHLMVELERLRAENATLRQAIKNHAEEAAKLQSQFDAMCALTEIRDRREEREKRLGVAEEAAKMVSAEPVAIYYGTIDCGETGAFNLEILRMIPHGAKLYTSARCESCDGTGDLVRADGEYIGDCPNCTSPRIPEGWVMVPKEPVAYLVEFDTGLRSLVFADENWNRIAKDTPGMVKLIAAPKPEK